jgi:hypothetical protein
VRQAENVPEPDTFFVPPLVAVAHGGHRHRVYDRASGFRRIKILKYFMRYRPGWWLLHLVMVSLTLWLGAITRFMP